MKKGFLIGAAILGFALVAGFIGWRYWANSQMDDTVYFEGIVLEANEASAMVYVTDGLTDRLASVILPEDYDGDLQAGEKIRVVYGGVVLTSYPVQIPQVESIELLGFASDEQYAEAKEFWDEYNDSMKVLIGEGEVEIEVEVYDPEDETPSMPGGEEPEPDVTSPSKLDEQQESIVQER